MKGEKVKPGSLRSAQRVQAHWAWCQKGARQLRESLCWLPGVFVFMPINLSVLTVPRRNRQGEVSKSGPGNSYEKIVGTEPG